MEQQNWDVFCSREPAGGLWYGMQLAKGLVERNNTVRLFTDGLEELSTTEPNVQPDLWIQSHEGLWLCNFKLGRLTAPAPNFVQVFNCAIPGNYLSRVTARSLLSNWLLVEACNSPRRAVRPLTLLESTKSYQSFLMQVGELPSCAGYIKRDRRVPAHEELPKSTIKASLLRAVGVPPSVFENKPAVYVSTTSKVPIAAWVHVLSTDKEACCMFVERGPAHDALTELTGVAAKTACCTTLGALTLVFLPPLSWSYADELICGCDVVLTDALDVVARAAELGTPVIWGGDGEDESQFLDWYINKKAPPDLMRALAFGNSALNTGHGVAQAWRWYRSLAAEAHAHSKEVKRRISRAPNLVDVAMAGIGCEDPHDLAEIFSPTQPGMPSELNARTSEAWVSEQDLRSSR